MTVEPTDLGAGREAQGGRQRGVRVSGTTRVRGRRCRVVKSRGVHAPATEEEAGAGERGSDS